MDFELTKTGEQFKIRGYDVFLCSNKTEAVDTILNIVKNIEKQNLTIGFGNSETIRSLNLIDKISNYTQNIYVHIPGTNTEDMDRKALLSDLYFTSANAISSDGYIINIDGTGNRTASTCFGPKHIIFVIGKNKISETLDSAIDRAKNVAAVGLAKKYNRKTPCVQTGKCENCQSPQCVCRVMTIHRKQLYGNKTTIVLIDEILGI